MRKMRWVKILANTGIAFFMSMTGIITYDFVSDNPLSVHKAVMIASLVSLLQAGLVFFREVSADDKRIYDEMKVAKSKGYITFKPGIFDERVIHWHVGLANTIRDPKMSLRFKIFAVIDSMVFD